MGNHEKALYFASKHLEISTEVSTSHLGINRLGVFVSVEFVLVTVTFRFSVGGSNGPGHCADECIGPAQGAGAA